MLPYKLANLFACCSSIMALSKSIPCHLGEADHEKVKRLGLEFQKANDEAKNVFIRDELDTIFAPHQMKWRLHPWELGIHPVNRDWTPMTAPGCTLRGGKILQSGFSYQAMGKLWGFEDHPQTKFIEKNTIKITSSDERWHKVTPGDIRAAPTNWTHSNCFVNMVIQGVKCDDPSIPCKDGHIDTTKIETDPKNFRLFEYAKKGMVWNIFPYWVEAQYPWIPLVYQAACNQEQQVQEGNLMIP